MERAKRNDLMFCVGLVLIFTYFLYIATAQYTFSWIFMVTFITGLITYIYSTWESITKLDSYHNDEGYRHRIILIPGIGIITIIAFILVLFG